MNFVLQFFSIISDGLGGVQGFSGPILSRGILTWNRNYKEKKGGKLNPKGITGGNITRMVAL